MKLYVKKCDSCRQEDVNAGYYYSNAFQQYCTADCLLEGLLKNEVCLHSLWDKRGRNYLLNSSIENKGERT